MNEHQTIRGAAHRDGAALQPGTARARLHAQEHAGPECLPVRVPRAAPSFWLSTPRIGARSAATRWRSTPDPAGVPAARSRARRHFCDGSWCHAAFANDRKLHFPLLSDFEPKGAVARAYGVIAVATDSVSERSS